MGITEFMGLNPLISILFCIEKGNKFLFCHIKKYLKITKVNKNDNYIKKKVDVDVSKNIKLYNLWQG